MRSLYESILDVDNNINRANTNIKNINKIKSIIHNFVDDIIDTNKYSYTLLQEFEDNENVINTAFNTKIVIHSQLAIKLHINEHKRDDYSVFTWFKSVLYKHKKDLMSIHKILGHNKSPEICYEKRYDDIYIEQQIDEYHDYNFHIREMKGEIIIVVGSIYISTI